MIPFCGGIFAHAQDVATSKRASLAKDDETKECLTTKWHTGQDMCSVAASNVVFGNCANGNTYDLGKCLDGATKTLANCLHQEAAWQLIGLSKWVISLLEKVMKECIMFCDVPEEPRIERPQDDLFSPTSGKIHSIPHRHESSNAYFRCLVYFTNFTSPRTSFHSPESNYGPTTCQEVLPISPVPIR
jgi:hypothetical protein